MFHQEQGILWWSSWLGFLTSTAGGTGSILGRQIKISQAAQCNKKKKRLKEQMNKSSHVLIQCQNNDRGNPQKFGCWRRVFSLKKKS